MIWQEWSNFGAGRLVVRSVKPYFYRDGWGGHNGSAVTAKSVGCEDVEGAELRCFEAGYKGDTS